MTVRIERLRAELERVGAASFLVSSPTNVEYLTGFASTNAFAVVGRDRVVVATDGRYIEAARALEGIEVVLGDRELAADVGRRLPDVAEPPVAFESSHLTYAGYEAISASGLELRPVARLVEGIRSVKDADELDAIRRAARITTTAYERLADESVVGRTEREVAWRLAQALHDEGAEDVAFPLIVASGPNAAVPHHHSGDRRIEAGETVIVDAGAKLDGYCSDCTRTFATGALPHDVQRAYEACREVQEIVLADIRAGADPRELDARARDEIEAAGYEVLHGLGHGVGLEVQELPVLRPTATGSLVAGNVVTVEPGVYIPGRGGVRIEDLVVVTDNGPEVLTPFAKELLPLH